MANQTSNSNSSQVRVVLRVRPFLPSEIDSVSNQIETQIPCVSILDQNQAGEVTVHLKDQFSSRNECYKLDSFFGQDNRVGQIFEQEVSAVIPGIFQGLNATVFAYGATGSGKTYTMQGTESEPGIIPMAMSALFSLCNNTQYTIDISYYEVYLDKCYDLLEPKAKEVIAMDDKNGNVQLKGLSKACVESMSEFSQIYTTGVQRRKTAHTGLNDVSSRSHAVLSIIISNGPTKGKLNLIDLAGNEDNRRTQNEGIRMQESVKINESLFALSNVISALNNRKSYIPYRESKLTRILQDSLGGSSRALMVACLNPSSYQEAVHTVSLAARSRQITNFVGPTTKQETPKNKIDMESKLRAWLESKGKVKSVQRLDGFLSPPLSSSVRGRVKMSSFSVRKEETLIRSSIKKNNGENREGVKTKKKISFDLKMDDFAKDMCSLQKETSITEKEIQDFNWETSKEETVSTTPCNKENLQLSPSNLQKSPLRKALSPISAYTCPSTPNITFEMDQSAKTTPLVKFNLQSSNIKESLVKDYLAFLNTASKEELMNIKGIGEKRAEYILEERENSPAPFKSLSDLERIGLSSKQVKDLFQMAARGIFS
ncbi:hypothetical protein LUZ60_010918 [Juncus effusus]|nr:hypothetical protein LUZ60_010918 [Juncus effusus]